MPIPQLIQYQRKMFRTGYWNSSPFAHLVLGGLFLGLASFCVVTGFSMTHDAIEWHGAFHYFYTSVARGVMPYWNPYSQTGTPFFNNFQSFGFLDPSQFLFILLQKFSGCTTLTTYVLQYLFRYYVFILGTYSTLRVLTRHTGSSLLFSLVLFFACFPIFMRQNGALNPFFLLPLTTYYLLMFFQESRAHRKGWYLLIISGLCGTSLNIHIPMFLLFYLLMFIVLVFVFKMAELKTIVRFLVSRTGLVWISLSLLVIVLLASPVVALYYELRHTPEYFPSVRLLQNNDNTLVRAYVSDLQEDLFAEEFTGNLKHSLTPGNFLGLLIEPFQHFFYGFGVSEVVLYLGILPLFGIWAALTKVKDRYTYFFSVIVGLLVFILCNFSKSGHPSLNQRMMLAIFPFLRMSDVLQNGGVLFLFVFVILGAIGFYGILEDRCKVLWSIPILFLVYKYIIFLPIVLGYEFTYYIHHKWNVRLVEALWFIAQYIYQNLFLWGILFVFALLMFRYARKSVIHELSLLSIRKLRYVAIAILFLDLLIFNGVHILYVNHILKQNYYDYLRQENLLHTKSESAFINYRVPFSFRDVESHKTPDYKIYDVGRKRVFNSFFGHEIYNVKKVAFPGVVEFMQSMKSGKHFFTFWDHFYMTTYYYDYLVNVKYEKQLVTSHIISPILNFFPQKNAVFVENKYEVIKRMNLSSLSELRTHIFVEQDKAVQAQTLDVSQFFDPDNYVTYTQEELASFEQNLHVQYPGNPDVQIDIVDYDINHLSLNVETPYDGYLYFGDGYSKHWKAFVDGKPTTIEKTNINFKSVYTPAGKHRVEFVFDPVLYRYSLYAYFVGILLFFAVGAVFLSKSRFRLGIYYNTPQKLDRILRCKIG